MNTTEEKKKLFSLLFQLDDYSKKINEINKEINEIIKKINAPPSKFESYITQLNNLIKTMKSELKTYYNQFRYNKINVPIEKDLKIYIGFKQSSGEVHTFEAQYGTTVDKLISTYLKVIIKNKVQNDLYFEYNNKKLNLGDMTLIENVFNDKQNPTIFVKNSENLNMPNNQNFNQTDINFNNEVENENENNNNNLML